jgi:hypothetical protein
MRCCIIRMSRRSASSARRRSRATSIRPAPARQARAGPGRRQEPHGGDARRRHGPGRRRADRRGLWLGRRALHGDLGRRCRSARRPPTSLIPMLSRAHPCAEDQERLQRSNREMGPLVVPAASRSKRIAGYIGIPASRAPSWSSTAARLPVATGGARQRLLDRRLAVRQRHAGHEDLQGRDLRPGARGGARAGPATPPSMINDTTSATACALHARRQRRA